MGSEGKECGCVNVHVCGVCCACGNVHVHVCVCMGANVCPNILNVLYLISEEVDNLKRVFHNPDGHEFLAIVASMHHQRVGETFYNGTLGWEVS